MGGNTLGLYGGVFGPDGTSISAHGYQGAFHHWKQQVGNHKVRVREVGGNTLGLYGGVFGPDGTSILAHGYQGAFHHWKQQKGNH